MQLLFPFTCNCIVERIQVCLLIFFTDILLMIRALNPGESECVNSLAFDIAKEFDSPSISFLRSNSSEIDDVPSAYTLSRLVGLSKTHSIYRTDNWQEYNVSGNFFISYYIPSFLKNLQESSYLPKNSFAIFFHSETQFEQLQQFAQNSSLFINSQFYIFDVSQCQLGAKVYGLYRVGERVDEVITEYGGPWTRSRGFAAPFLSKDLIDRRRDFMGYPMIGVGVKIFPHFTTYLDNGGVSGFVGDVVTALQRIHNFTLNIKILPGYAYGSLVDIKTNSWNGMTGELQNKKVDLTVSELSLTMERAKVVTYTQPLYIVSRKMYVGTTIDNKRKLLTYTTTMSLDLYIATFIMIFILAFSLVALSRLMEYLLPGMGDLISFSDALWYMFSAILQQGIHTSPVAICTRMVFWYGFMMAVVVITAYSATLVSHLAVVLPVPLPFSDINGLIKSSGWDAGNVKNDLFQVTAAQTCALSLTEDCRVLQTLWKDVITRSDGNLVDTYTEGLKRALKRNYVFIGVDVTTINFIKQLPPSEGCSIRELSPKYITGGIGIGLQYQSPFLDTFDNSLQKMKEIGMMDKIVNKWLKAVSSCSPEALVSADLYDVGSLFTVLILGVGFGLLVMLAEYTKHRRWFQGKKASQKTQTIVIKRAFIH